MTMNLFRVLLVIVLSFAASPVLALDTLLLELSWHQPEPVTLPAVYAFGAYDAGNDRNALWFEDVTAFGHVSWADRATVDSFNLPMTQPLADQYYPLLSMHNNDQFPEGPEPGCATCWFSRLVAHQSDVAGTGEEWAARAAAAGWEVNLHVPLLGLGLSGYTLTDIQRVVTQDAQTIRLYGVVPEPGSWLLALLGLIHVSRQCRWSALRSRR